MIAKQLNTVSHFLIGIGIICQVVALSDSLIRYWSFLSILAVCPLGLGYYINLKSKGYVPFRSGWFYGLTVLSLLPLIGPLAAARKLRIMPAYGDPKGTRPVVHGLFLVLIAGIGVVVWLFISEAVQHMKIYGHIEKAEQQIRFVQQFQREGKDFTVELTTAENEIRAAKDMAAGVGSKALDAIILRLSAEVHFLGGKWKEAEQDYTKLLETGGYRADEARKRLSQLKERRSKEHLPQRGNAQP